jgi:hypothetical protein
VQGLSPERGKRAQDARVPDMTKESQSTRQTALLGLAVSGLAAGGILHFAGAGDAEQWAWGLHAILSLHFAQEEELYSLLES